MTKTTPPFEPDPEERDDAVIGSALRWSLAVFALLLVSAGVFAFVMTRKPPLPVVKATPFTAPKVREQAHVEIPEMLFKDITVESGIHFVHENGAYGDKLLPETMGSGCAFFDYDNDGRPDLLFINSCRWPWDANHSGPAPTMALYHNEGGGRFLDVTAHSGLDQTFYGMGVACGDYDQDGWVDLFISAVGFNRLFRNRAGKFEETTDSAGVGGSDREWSTSCSWFDYDHDGDLDLFVGNYIRWSKEIDLGQDFRLVGVGRAYGPPMAFEGTFPYLYRNDGEGKFTDVSEAAGIQVKNPATGQPMAKSMGIAPVDLDGDGWLDLVVANDTVQNFVFQNQRNGTFREIGALSGVAFDSSGNARGAMGIDAARFRNDDSLGLAIGNFANEMTALYVSQGNTPLFTDDAIATGLGPPTRLELTFGVFFFDCDLDGRLDIFAANGHLEQDINKVQSSQHYAQPPHLFWNCGAGHSAEFLAVPESKCGPDLTRPLVGRGAAFADIDGDGDLDLVITASGGPPRLLRNDQKPGHHWLRIKLVGRDKNRDAIGAWAEVRIGEQHFRRDVMPTRGYCSQSELPLTIGLGPATHVDQVQIHWPDGTTQEVQAPAIDEELRIEQPEKRDK